MDSSSGFTQKLTSLESRNFSLRLSKFSNGYFVSISEGDDKIGAMMVSLATGPSPITTSVIPSKSESLMLKIIAERISTRVRGVAIVSLSVRSELNSETAKALMTEIMDMIQNE